MTRHDCVTGCTGFIGSRLLDKLHARGGSLGNRISHITPWGRCGEIPNDCDNLFFLSTYGNMADHINAFMMLRANVMDVIRALSRKPEWFCYMSSSSVTLPVQTPYSRTKRAAEEILQALPELKSCIVRPYSVFGKSEQPSHLIPTLIRSCFEGEQINFAPDPVHDWISVDDVVDALILFADKQVTGIYELGTGWGRTNVQVLDTIERISGKKANINVVSSLRSYDNSKWVCNDTSASKLGWCCKRTFNETIEEVIEDYKQSPQKYANPKL